MNSALCIELFEDMLKDFVLNEVKPIAGDVDETERFPRETVDKMVNLGLLGIVIPTQYGGAGGNYHLYVDAVRFLSHACATTGVILGGHHLCVTPVMEFGTDAQKAKYLPILTKELGAFALTEPNAGTDSSNQQTTAVLDGDEYVLNGNKIFITNGGEAAVYIVFAMTDKSLGNHGITAFIVEAGTKGFAIGKHEKKMGIRGSATTELIFTNCRIPKENLLGQVGDGFKIAMRTLDCGRIGISAQALGIAEGAFEEAVKFVKERKQFGRSIAAFQNTQFKIADMATRIEAAKHLVFQAADKKDSGLKVISVYSAMAKLFASETAMAVTTECVQLCGGYGYTREYPLERMMRDAKITEIYEGTSEVQRMVISGAYLK